MKNDSFQPLSAEDLAEIKEWLKNNAEQLPTKIRLALENYERLCNMKSASRAKLLRMLLELQRSMGIIASSEKRNSKDPIGATSANKSRR